MALPAGRYGVTKEQLRKIKRLPINTIGMITETKEGIAIVEDGPTASQLITAGRQFWHGGKLYSADVDISEGVAIVTSGEGKNASLMPSITDQLPGTDAEKANEVTIARVENGSSPTATISEGEQFYHSGILYTATADIATTDTITPNSNCVVSDSVTEQIASLDAQKADNSVIAPVENGSTASQAYEVGSHAIRNGKFITWKNAKAQGETINDASDYTSGDVADILDVKTASATEIVDSGVTIDSTRNLFVRQGNVVNFKIRFTVEQNITSAKNIFTLPYEPWFIYPYFDVRNTSAPYAIIGAVYANGLSVRCNVDTLTAGTYDINGVYICK